MAIDFETIVSVSGLPGLYQVVANRNNGLIIADLGSGKKRFAPARTHQFSLLASIGVYTEEGTEELKNVFLRMSAQEAERPDPNKSSDTDLRGYFTEVIPEHDPDMVRIADIRKILKWFNYLADNDLLPEAETAGEEEE